MAKVLLVLYADPVEGYPTDYPRDGLPNLDCYPDGQTLPSPKAIDFRPGALLGSVSGELGLRTYLEGEGIAMRWSPLSRADNSRAMPATYGSPSRRRRIIRGGRCHTTA